MTEGMKRGNNTHSHTHTHKHTQTIHAQAHTHKWESPTERNSCSIYFVYYFKLLFYFFVLNFFFIMSERQRTCEIMWGRENALAAYIGKKKRVSTKLCTNRGEEITLTASISNVFPPKSAENGAAICWSQKKKKGDEIVNCTQNKYVSSCAC